MKVAFVSDTGSGLSPKQMLEDGIYGIPLQITYNETTYLESVEISLEETNALLNDGVELKTSLASMRYCEAVFERLKLDGYDCVFAIPICTGLSGTINMMRIVAEEYGLQFAFFDCHVTAELQYYMIKKAKELYEKGQSLDMIKNVLEDVCVSANTLLIPNDLKHLQRGGRLTPFAATLGGLLKIKPILQINKQTHGKIDVLDKVRTMSRAMDSTVSLMKKVIPNEGAGYCIAVTHVLSEDNAKVLLSKYEEVFPKAEYTFKPLVSVVGIHTGVGCLAVQFFKKAEEKEG